MKNSLSRLLGLGLLLVVATSNAQENVAVQSVEPPLPEVQESNGNISIDFKDAELQQVLRIISLKSGVDIVAGPDVTGVITIKLTNVPWEQALDIILRTYGFTYERQNDIVRVMTVEALQQEALSTRVFPLDYANAEEVQEIILEMLSDRGRIRFDTRTNTVIVTDIPTAIFQIQEVIARLDQRTPQVLIATKVVETKLERNENLGIDWADNVAVTQTATTLPTSFPFKDSGSLGVLGDLFVASQVPSPDPANIAFGTLTGPAFSLTMNILNQRTDTHIVSNPTLAVLDNQEARIHIGEDFPVPNFTVDPSTGNTVVSGFDTRTIGTVLTVTPHVNPNHEIVVDLFPEIVSFNANATFAISDTDSVSLPRFTTQSVQTQVRVRDGETIAIGGLVKTIELKEDTRVPILGDIPIVGRLFQNVRVFGGGTSPRLQQDLLIFMTVELLSEEESRQMANR